MLSRNTVRKYLRMDENAISEQIENPSRTKRLDDHRDYLVHLLKKFSKPSVVRSARKLQSKVGELLASDRSIRRYERMLKEEVASAQICYYEPILDDVPGVQCQVDPGELRSVLIGGDERALHFVVFVLSYSRLMYVGLAFRPLDTQTFIQLHDEALRYFGGLPEEAHCGSVIRQAPSSPKHLLQSWLIYSQIAQCPIWSYTKGTPSFISHR